MRNYIKSKKSLEKGNFITHSAISIIVKDDILFDLDMTDLEKVIDLFPKSITRNVDYIIFGDFDFLNKLNYNASYKDGAIYVSNRQDNNLDVLDDIVHEIGHSVEDNYYSNIYGDNEIEKEFIKKRMILKKEFDKEGISIPDEAMYNPEYNQNLDLFFSQEIGYPRMTAIVQGIFYSPYAATSLREYFANGFEAYYYHKDIYLQRVSPVLFNKLESLEELFNESWNRKEWRPNNCKGVHQN